MSNTGDAELAGDEEHDLEPAPKFFEEALHDERLAKERFGWWKKHQTFPGDHRLEQTSGRNERNKRFSGLDPRASELDGKELSKMGTHLNGRYRFRLALLPEASLLTAGIILGLSKAFLKFFIEGESQESGGETFADDEFIEKPLPFRPNIGQQSTVFIHNIRIIGEPDFFLEKVKKGESLGKQRSEGDVLPRVIDLRRVYTDEPDVLLRSVGTLNPDGVAVIDRHHETGIRQGLLKREPKLRKKALGYKEKPEKIKNRAKKGAI